MIIDKQIQSYKKELSKVEEITFDKNLIQIIVEWLGPSIYHPIDKYIDIQDDEEMKKVKVNFLIDKLNLSDSKILDNAIKNVSSFFIIHQIANYRALYYYFLVKELKIDNLLINNTAKTESTEKLEHSLLEFGERLVKSQRDIDLDLKKILDDNFASLL